MKKEARQEAEEIFLDAQGKISNVEIAKKVGADPQTVGKWKKAGEWAAKLTKRLEQAEEKKRPRGARKAGEHDEAFKLYLASQGKMPNKELARRVGVSPASIANWKTSEHWADKLKKKEERLAPEPVSVQVPVKAAPVSEEEPERTVIDLDELTCPEHITKLNKKIDDILNQEYLSPKDLRTIAEAKEAVLGVVSAYMDLLEWATEE